MDELERMKRADIRAFCRSSGQVIRYKNRDWYLYQVTIYDAGMNAIIPEATNGFLDLYEYFEYFPQPQISSNKKGDTTLSENVKTIKSLCETYSLSQTELSRRYSIPLRTVQDWYAGRRTPPEYVVNMLGEQLALAHEKKN